MALDHVVLAATEQTNPSSHLLCKVAIAKEESCLDLWIVVWNAVLGLCLVDCRTFGLPAVAAKGLARENSVLK